MAVGQNQWYRFGVGVPPILVFFSGDWDVHWGYDLDLDPWPYVPGCDKSSQDFISAAKEAEWDTLREILGRHPGYAPSPADSLQGSLGNTLILDLVVSNKDAPKMGSALASL